MSSTSLGEVPGATVMLMLAPRAGKQTRFQVQRQGTKLRHQAVDSMEEAVTDVGDKVYQFTDSVQIGVVNCSNTRRTWSVRPGNRCGDIVGGVDSGGFSNIQGKVQMNKNVYEGIWKEMWAQVKEWWGELTDDELEQTGGRADPLVDLLQQKCGYTRECAEAEFNRRLKGMKGAVKRV